MLFQPALSIQIYIYIPSYHHLSDLQTSSPVFQCVCHGTWTVLSTNWLSRGRTFGFKMRQKPGRFYYPWCVMEKWLTKRSFLGLSFSVCLSLSFFHSSLLKLRSIRLWHQGSDSIAVLSDLSSKLLKKTAICPERWSKYTHCPSKISTRPLGARHTCPAPSPVSSMSLIASPRAHCDLRHHLSSC